MAKHEDPVNVAKSDGDISAVLDSAPRLLYPALHIATILMWQLSKSRACDALRLADAPESMLPLDELGGSDSSSSTLRKSSAHVMATSKAGTRPACMSSSDWLSLDISNDRLRTLCSPLHALPLIPDIDVRGVVLECGCTLASCELHSVVLVVVVVVVVVVVAGLVSTVAVMSAAASHDLVGDDDD